MTKELLTRRELEILKLASEGLSNKQIADKIFRSIETVKKHLENIFRKLNAKNKIQALNNWSHQTEELNTGSYDGTILLQQEFNRCDVFSSSY